MTTTVEVLAMPRRAYSYSRVSDPKQAKAGRDGLRRQDDYAQQLCAENDWCLDDSLVFTDKGKSGFHGDNLGPTAALTAFLAAVETRRVIPGSVLIIENIDRLSRQEVDLAYDLFRSIIKAGIWIATKTPPRIYKKESNSIMDLMEPIWLMYLAYMESLKKSERLNAKWQKRRELARSDRRLPHGRNCPRWIGLTDAGYELIPERAQTVRTIFRLAAQGLGNHRITAFLNAHPEHAPFGRAGTWLSVYVTKILRSRAALGEYQPTTGRGCNAKKAGQPIPRYYPAVIDEDEWRLAQAAIDGRRHTYGRPGQREASLFTGIAFEAPSGQPLSISQRTTDGKVYRYLTPCKYNGCSRIARSVPYPQFEDGVLRRIGSLEPSDVLPNKAFQEREARIAELTARLVAIDHRAAEIGREIADPDNARVVRYLAKSLDAVEAEKEAVIKELEPLKLASLTGRAETLAETQTVIDLLEEARGNAEEGPLRLRLKATIRHLVEEIWLVLQPITGRSYLAHVQVYLRGGARRYVAIPPQGRYANLPAGFRPWRLKDCDFRAGDVGDAADILAAPHQLVG